MVNGLNLLFQFIDSFGFIVLAAIGLAVIFGMMGVINLGHGEFILIGAYGTTLSANAGLPLPAAMAVGVVVTAVFGVIVERTIISGAGPNWLYAKLRAALPAGTAASLPEGPVVEPLYDRLLDSMVATFAIGLIVTQGARIVWGNSLSQVGTPLGTINYGAFSYSAYRIALGGVAVLVLATIYVVFTRTEFGVRARATIQDPDTARAMGVDTDRMYAVTFGVGSALAGLTGALYAPTRSIVPDMGSGFLVEAFVGVVVGGPSVLLGTSLAGGLLGAVDSVVTNLLGSTFFGQIALLLTAIVAIRLLPDGLTGLVGAIRDRLAEEG
jgi:branched-chain amino acid transport system permease protein